MSRSDRTPKQYTLSGGGLTHLVRRWLRGPEASDLPIPVQILIAIAVLWLPIMHLMVRGEEEHLEKVFGDAYREYREQTPRYLGLPKR